MYLGIAIGTGSPQIGRDHVQQRLYLSKALLHTTPERSGTVNAIRSGIFQFFKLRLYSNRALLRTTPEHCAAVLCSVLQYLQQHLYLRRALFHTTPNNALCLSKKYAQLRATCQLKYISAKEHHVSQKNSIFPQMIPAYLSETWYCRKSALHICKRALAFSTKSHVCVKQLYMHMFQGGKALLGIGRLFPKRHLAI